MVIAANRKSFQRNLMFQVDGMSSYKVAVHVAIGDEPHFEPGKGKLEMAAKFLYRRFDPADARCVKASDDDALARLKERQPDTLVMLKVHESMRLSDVPDQEPYSWTLAELVIGGASVADLDEKFEEAVNLLPYQFDPPSRPQTAGGGSEVHP